jgi:hypothetical protein
VARCWYGTRERLEAVPKARSATVS